ncbi:methyl-accepting chemotaxis protein, partial [Ramlibacter sp.]|uniref:methyl-accepting chemotaxis protein n=1 Tax=Ramlibacter sp. TaxID=1917967 RepID=UPI002C591695
MKFSNLKIGARLGVAFGILLMLVAAIGGLGVATMASIEGRLEQIVGHHMAQVKHADVVSAAIRDIMLSMSIIVQAQDPAVTTAQKAKIAAARDTYGKAKKALAENAGDELTRALLSRIDTTLKPAAAANNRVMALADGGQAKEASDLFLKESEPAGNVLIAAVDQIVAHQRAQADAAAHEAAVEYERARIGVMLAVALVFALGAATAWLSTRSITRPLRRALAVAETVAKGDLTVQVEVGSRDETGRLLQALKDMNGSLGTLVGRVRAGTDAIATASGQIATGNQDLSQRTEEQASSLEETAASMEELTGTVKQNADNARQANQLAQSAADVAVKGGTVVGQVVDTMASINESS